MSRSLENFESWIAKSMVSKGGAYWASKSVKNLAQDGEEWDAEVYFSKEAAANHLNNNL